MNNQQIGSFEKTLPNTAVKIHYKQIKLNKEHLSKYLNPNLFNSYCKNGCPNHSQKWTCPPFCPPFEEYSKNHTSISLYLLYTSPKQFIQFDEKDRSLSAYNFIKEELQSFLRKKELPNEKMIAANSCEFCKTCKVAEGKACHIPEKIRYNLVAFGFDVSAIMTDLFQHKIEWAKENKVPNMVSSVGAILNAP